MQAKLSMSSVLLGLALAVPASTASAAVIIPPLEAGDTAMVQQARSRGGGGHVRGGGGYVRHHGGHVRHYGGHRRHYGGPVLLYGLPSVGYYGYGSGHCAWLYRNARATGSRYWWSRYHNEC